MAFRIMPFAAAKKIRPVKPPEVCDFSSLADIQLIHTLDLSHLRAIEALPIFSLPVHLLKQPDVFEFPMDSIQQRRVLNLPVLADVKGRHRVLAIDLLEVSEQSPLDLIPEAEIIGDRLLFGNPPPVSEPLDDGLGFADAVIIADILGDPLDDGSVFSSVEIVDALLHLLSFEEPTILQFVDFLEIPEIISPSKLMTHPRTLGKDYRSRYAIDDDEQVGTQLTFTDSVRKCRHGVIRSHCSICVEDRARAAKRRTERQPQVVDVFEQLFYILQPPILPARGQPLIFPNGHKPYPFQIGGVKWLVERQSALLADEMGLGKTIQAIIAIRILFRHGELQRTLVVCPASMTNTWEREIRSWAPELRLFRLQGNRATRTEAWKSNAEISVVSYETLRNDIREFEPAQFDLCVLDEAHKIKNPSTRVHNAVKRLSPKYRWALTGTPLENSVEDVVALFSFLKPGLFYEGNADWNPPREVRGKISPYILRRIIDDVKLDLPKKTHQEHWLDLLPKQSRAYCAMEDREVETLKRKGAKATRVHVFALINSLKQTCNFDESSGESCKLNFLEDELDSLSESREKALVFSQYPEKTLKVIEPRLRRYSPLIFHGSLSGNRREEMLLKFEGVEEHGVLLMSLKAGGVGLTLTRASHVFLYDHWWNPAVMDQAMGRVYRIGQERPVFSHSLYTVGTIEERIHNLLKEKRILFQEMFGQEPTADDEALNRLTDKDLFGLFGLDVPGNGNGTQKKAIERPYPSEPNVGLLKETQTVQAEEQKPRKLSELSPIEFEGAIRDLFHWWKRCLLHTTNASYDGGIDLDGYRLYAPPMRVVVQCKRYRGTVSVGQVREFYGVVASEGDIGESYMVTTGKFSDRANRFARRMGITLIDGEELDYFWSEFRRQSGH